MTGEATGEVHSRREQRKQRNRVATQHPTAHWEPQTVVTLNYRACRNEGWRGSLRPHYVKSTKN